ncbi:MAG: hypothetical protein OEN21_18755 [Myxococcales bacterium]|jgi:hypothetical protein|nr:hypothetical protein [Myxococcales bacterium]
MRLFILSLTLPAILVGCGGDSGSVPQAAVVRLCGELDGVEPVEPVLLGQYPIELINGEIGSCPMFAPVPCTETGAYYKAVCGEGCVARSAVSPEGDTWVVGCSRDDRLRGCSEFDFERVECARDPYDGNPYWFTFRECQHTFFPYSFCWQDCAGDPLGDSAEWCP